jgi:hypothetical protein
MADSTSSPSVSNDGAAPEVVRKPVASLSLRRKPVQGSDVSSTPTDTQELVRQRLQRSGTSYASVPPEGSVLTGKQEHCKLSSEIRENLGCKRWSCALYLVLTELSFECRSEARNDLTTSPVRNHRARIPDGFTTIRSTVSIG